MRNFTDRLFNADCMEILPALPDSCADFILTDIPYGAVSRKSGGLRPLDKGAADIPTFSLRPFLRQVSRVAKGSLAIFCGKEQFSEIYSFFAERKGTVRALVWEKTNPSPMNGRHVYLSGVELAVWFRGRGATFNAFCKNTVFRHPNGSSRLHPTEKNRALMRELIADNTREGDLVLDPCMGSGSHLLAAFELGRRFMGIELDPDWFRKASERLSEAAANRRIP